MGTSLATEFKIPTLLGIAILLVGLTSSLLLVNQKQILFSKASTSAAPKNINVTNITAQSATIYWETDESAQGFVKASPLSSSLDQTYQDERDTQGPQKYHLHFVTLNNLNPLTTYYFKINSGGDSYPKDNLSFKTANNIDPTNNPPLIGTVVDENQKPIDEALVTLDIEGAQTISTITKLSGNFILPLASLKTADLQSSFDLSKPVPVKLKIFNLQKQSIVSLELPMSSPINAPLVLGVDKDLILEKPTPIPTQPLPDLDLNHDGSINSLDLSVITKNLSKKTFPKEADLNGDGVVDQKDIEMFKSISATQSAQPAQ